MTRRLALLLPLLLCACSQPAAQGEAAAAPAAGSQPAALTNPCPPGTGPSMRFELQLGGDIGAKEFGDFVDAEVTPRFPRGVTVVDARSQSQEANSQISREAVRILIIVVPNSLTASAYVAAIGSAYNERFDQDSALLSQTPGCGGYIGTALPD